MIVFSWIWISCLLGVVAPVPLRIEVVDSAVISFILPSLNRYISNYLWWNFSIDHGNYFLHKDLLLSSDERPGIRTNYSNSPWTVDFPIQLFKETGTWREIRKLLTSLGETNKMYPRYVKTIASWRTDQVFLQSCIDDNDYLAFVCLTESWKKNWYGELTFYSSHGNHTEVERVVHVKPGRVVLASCGSKFAIKPPAINSNVGNKMLVVMATASQKVSQAAEKVLLDEKDALKKIITANHYWFPLTSSEEPPNVNAKDFLSNHVQVGDLGDVYVFDGVFHDEDIHSAAQFILKNATYHEVIPEENTDNVYWVSGYNIASFVKSHLWLVGKQLIKYVTGDADYSPYDVSCNLIRTSDYSQIHKDCAHGNDEFTFLLYLNKDWKIEYYGETIFFDDSDELEPVLAVKPKFGRIVIFNCLIPHSARPPSILVNGARLTFAVKVSNKKVFQNTSSLHDDKLTLIEFLETANEDTIEKIGRNKLNRIFDQIDQGTASSDEVTECLNIFEEAEKEYILELI
ncbi:uncharacterized protein LOC100378795 [Saccoglossus kowalevskii]|uniref:Uncharacterized protein LOC100378795 n=1 Tax=Saccoglossus kowalevskii TaxID=10224 RepID=A0ABM0LUA9_SACKO|nr:PREDICTED: uncharacterized protein LOC100378795 [Saccoglossus kowalevskii]